MDPHEHAIAAFDQGFNCAESVLTALCTAAGRDVGELRRLATPFGSGISRRGTVCGCLSGAAMAIGLLAGRSTPEDAEGKERAYGMVERLLGLFERTYGSTECRTLTGLDFHDPAAVGRFREDIRGRVCVPAIRFTVENALSELRAAGIAMRIGLE
ncbi:MAG: C-GCAxxG-C-C family protein [Candidatus Eisenbacteria bacterium]|jgi:C_GCAxxG_C_C family probable redox protein|nr:C-GCAxxG-C-C family protein [Candidatus Eisenbacteria bacterium]